MKDHFIDADGNPHTSIEVTHDLMVKSPSIEDEPKPFVEYEKGLTHYFVDGQEITPDEFFRLFPHARKNRQKMRLGNFIKNNRD